MASTYTPLGIEKMATGENAGTWGTKTNANLDLAEQLLGGFKTVSIAGGAGTTTLTVADGALTGTAQARMIEFTGSITGNRIVTIPLDVETFYILKNATSGAYTVQFKYVSGSGDTFTFAATNKGTSIVFATANDGTNPDIIEVQTGGDVVDDTSPQLGGDLDVNGNKIVSTSNGNIELEPNGTGDVILDTDQVTIGGGAEVGQLSSNGAYDLKLVTNSNTNSGNITITDGANGAITATPNGTGEVVVGGNTNPGTLVLNCESNSHGIKLQSPAHSSGQSYTLKFPTGNVTADRFLKVASVSGSGTTGVGQLSFSEVSGGTSWQAVKTSATFTAVAGEGYFINTTSNAIEMDLPAGSIGDEISFIDYAGTFDSNALTIDQNGTEKILGSTDPLTVSVERAANTLVYVDGTQGWLLKNK
ncbi:hypothetical protein N9308_03090 [Candidatus Pelagibacter sp.]|nr:hypothetical protein [Candidatus Pelagibacter sp.]